MLRKILSGVLQGTLASRRQKQELRRTRRTRSRALGRFLQNHMRVRAPDSKRIHRSAQGTWTCPIAQLFIHDEWAVCKIDFCIRSFEVQAGWNLLVLKCQRRFNKADSSSRGIKVTDIAFYRSDRTKILFLRSRAKCLRQGLYFNWVSQFRSGSVCLDITYALRIDP